MYSRYVDEGRANESLPQNLPSRCEYESDKNTVRTLP
jgi:hypothetical protein